MVGVAGLALPLIVLRHDGPLDGAPLFFLKHLPERLFVELCKAEKV